MTAPSKTRVHTVARRAGWTISQADPMVTVLRRPARSVEDDSETIVVDWRRGDHALSHAIYRFPRQYLDGHGWTSLLSARKLSTVVEWIAGGPF